MKPLFLISLTLGILLRAASPVPAVAPVITVGDHYVLPNDASRKIAVTVSGGTSIQGVNFYAQIGDGGVDNGPPAGTDTKPVITAVDLIGPGTIFSASNNGVDSYTLSGGLIWQAITTTQDSISLPASGTLAYLTLNTAGTAAGQSYSLKLDHVADRLPGGDFTTDFGTVSASINDGHIYIVGLHDMVWNAPNNGNWTDTTWTGSLPPYPNYTARAFVNTNYAVQVDSPQEANQLTLSGGGRVAIGSAGSLAVTTSVNVNAGGTLSLTSGAGLSASGINVAGGTLSGSGTVVPTVTLSAGGSLAAPALSDTLTIQNTLGGSGGLTKKGLGTVTLKGNAAYTGSTSILDGLLQLQGTTSTLGTISGFGSLSVGGITPSSLTCTSISVNTLTIGSGFKATSASAEHLSSPVPEPSAFVLLTLAAVMGFCSVQRRRSRKNAAPSREGGIIGINSPTTPL
jgi:autotransporter-associated beta strand protein